MSARARPRRERPRGVLRGVADAELLHLTVGDSGEATSFDEQGAVGVRGLKKSERSVAHATDDRFVGDHSRGLRRDGLGTAEIPSCASKRNNCSEFSKPPAWIVRNAGQ